MILSSQILIGDGIKDILTGGNSYDPDVSTGNYDARAAQLLKGDGKGEFSVSFKPKNWS